MHEHVMGSKGARLLQVVRDAGISFHVARTWDGDRKLERKLKNRKNAKFLCPECEKERREKANGVKLNPGRNAKHKKHCTKYTNSDNAACI